MLIAYPHQIVTARLQKQMQITIVALTADLSTLEALLAHFTSANNLTNNWRVLAEKLYISILRSISVFRGRLEIKVETCTVISMCKVM